MVLAVLQIGVACGRGTEMVSPTPPAATPMDLRGDGASLEPGLYTFRPFEPGATFRLGGGWAGGHTNPEFFDVWFGEDLAVMFADPGFFVLEGGDQTPVEDLDARGATDILTARTALDASDPEPVSVGDASGYGFDLTATEETEVFGGPAGELTVPVGWFHRYHVLDVDDDVVLVIVAIEGDRDDVALRRATSVLRTIRWGRPPA